MAGAGQWGRAGLQRLDWLGLLDEHRMRLLLRLRLRGTHTMGPRPGPPPGVEAGLGPAMGLRPRLGLALGLGPRLVKESCLVKD